MVRLVARGGVNCIQFNIMLSSSRCKEKTIGYESHCVKTMSRGECDWLTFLYGGLVC